MIGEIQRVVHSLAKADLNNFNIQISKSWFKLT